MSSPRVERIEEVLLERKRKITQYIVAKEERQKLQPVHIRDAVLHALGSGGKALRPAILLLSCGALGGNEETALPAAAAVEVYHTWTLVHDDIIDRDLQRRSHTTVHEEFRRRAIQELGYSEEEAKHYGISMGILAGDALEGWAVSSICELTIKDNVDPALALYLVYDLTTRVQSVLIEGETLDVQYGRLSAIDELDEYSILEMLRKKTAVLYDFAAQAGAMIALNTTNPNERHVQSLKEFADKCGVAFQLRDDILGVIGDEKTLGKPVGSDLREGKKTIIVHHAFLNASSEQRSFLMRVLGNELATRDELVRAADLLVRLGGIDRAQQLAQAYIGEAAAILARLPSSSYRDLLLDWAHYLVERES